MGITLLNMEDPTGATTATIMMKGTALLLLIMKGGGWARLWVAATGDQAAMGLSTGTPLLRHPLRSTAPMPTAPF